MISTTGDEKKSSCKETQNIPVDEIVVKHLISQANDLNSSNRLIYLFIGNDFELTQGNITWKNFSIREGNCILARRSVVLLKQAGININNVLSFTPLSLQTASMAEYMRNENTTGQSQDKNKVFSITPDVKTLTKVVKYFITTTGWTRVGLLHDGTKLSEQFVKLVGNLKEVYPLKYDGSNANQIYNHFKDKNIRVILFSGSVEAYLQALDDLYDFYYTGTG